MGSSGFLDTLGDAMSTTGGGSGRSSHRRHSSRSRPKKRHSPSPSRSRSRSSSRRRGSKSIAGSFFGDSYSKRNSSRSTFFGLGSNFSRSSLFGGSRPSYYKRSPRQGFVHRATKQLKRLIRDLAHYAKRHPWKVFFLVIVPLLGGLGALLARFGVRVPAAVEKMLGMASRAASGDAFGAVNDAVRMAGDLGGSYRGARVERGRPPAVQYVSSSRSTYNGPRDEGDWVDNIGRGVQGMAKYFS
ncbi:hypothetical protein PT974_08655 [Cladobotryum mycophilum]|uniref:Uncharacterized protein n=1 Tax=Cladobotryum mycophilum TaxID=491253 RepID=A0ABR0SDX6_9HYPO